MAYNNNSNFNPYYTPNYYSDITNPAYPNFDQSSVPEWSYPNEYNPHPPSYDYNFHNNFNSSQSSWGFESPESNSQPNCPPYPSSPHFSQNSYSDPPIQNRTPSILEMMSRNESKQKSPSILDMMIRESTDSQIYHDYPSYFQVQSEYDPPIDYEGMLAAMTEAKLARDHDIDLMVECLHRPADSDIDDHLIRADEPSCLEQQVSNSVPSCELAETSNSDNLASFSFPELELECDLDSQIYDQVQIPESLLTPVLLPDLGNILESVLIPTSIIPELESPPLSHIPLWEDDCGLEFQFFDLDPLLELSPTPEPLLDLSFFPESVFVPVLPMSKSIIPSFHTPFWDKEVETINSEIYYEIWKFDGVEILKNDYTYILVGYVRKVSGGFHQIICYLDWAAFRGPIRPPPEPPP